MMQSLRPSWYSENTRKITYGFFWPGMKRAVWSFFLPAIPLLAVIDEIRDVFLDSPGHCDVVRHKIHVMQDFKPCMICAYLVSETVKMEI